MDEETESQWDWTTCGRPLAYKVGERDTEVDMQTLTLRKGTLRENFVFIVIKASAEKQRETKGRDLQWTLTYVSLWQVKKGCQSTDTPLLYSLGLCELIPFPGIEGICSWWLRKVLEHGIQSLQSGHTSRRWWQLGLCEQTKDEERQRDCTYFEGS